MKNLGKTLVLALLAASGTTYAQTTPVSDQPSLTSIQNSKTIPDFASPQSPMKPTSNPSEDTLIKGHKDLGIIKDTIIPTAKDTSSMSSNATSKKSEMDTTRIPEKLGTTGTTEKSDTLRKKQ